MLQDDRINCLENYLTELYVLFNQTQHYHWNVVGSSFKDMHEFFEQQYQQLYEMIDEIAERIRAMGSFVDVSVLTLAKNSSLCQSKLTYPVDYTEMLKSILLGHIELSKLAKDIVQPCDACGDYATKHIMSEKTIFHEKSIWMINSLLTKL